MRNRFPVVALVLLAACTRATASTSPSPAASPVARATAADACPVAPIPGDLGPTRDAYIAAWQGTDADAVGRFLLDDARVQTDDRAMTGRVAITSSWIREDIGKLSDLRMTARSVSQTGGTDVTESGVMTLRFRHVDGTVTNEGGRYTHVWARQPDGTWRLREARLTRGAPAGC